MKITRFTVLVGAMALLLSCLVLQGSSQAQSMDGLSQLLSGVGLGGHNSGQGQGQATATVMVDRTASPYTGSFTGKEATASETKSLDAKFACYPAHDPAFDKTDAFVCYAAQ
jgi:hypothetical protein